jgi:hypothetical protein
VSVLWGGRGVIFVKLTGYAGHSKFGVHFDVRAEHLAPRDEGGGCDRDDIQQIGRILAAGR